MKNIIKSVLLLGNYRPSLTLARKLKKRGYNIIVSSHGCDKSCDFSNAVSEIWDHSPLTSSPDLFIEEIYNFIDRRPDIVAIYLVAEEYVRLIAEHEDRFRPFPDIISMPAKVIKNCLDKHYMMKLALENDVPTAPFASVSGLKEFTQVAEDFGFPFVIRPIDSTKRLDGKKAIFIEDKQTFTDVIDTLKSEKIELLVQKKFTGKRRNIYFACEDGTLVKCLHAVINRTDSIDDTGLAVDGVTLSTNSELVEQTKRLLVALNYTGIGCAQYLVDCQTGETSFLEINPRIAGNHALPEYAGLELGSYLFDQARGKLPDQTPFMAKAGIHYCWTSGDLMGTKIAYLRGEINIASATKRCFQAVLSGLKSNVHMVFSLSDPKPGLMALWNVVPRIARWKSPEPLSSKKENYQDVMRK